MAEPSLRTRLLLALSAAAGVALLAFVALTTWTDQAALDRYAQTRLNAEAERTATLFNGLLENAASMARTTAAAVTSHRQLDRDEISPLLTDQLASNPRVMGLGLSFAEHEAGPEPSGSYYVYRAANRIRSLSSPALPQTGLGAWTAPIADITGQGYVLARLQIPFQREDEQAGVITVDLALGEMVDTTLLSHQRLSLYGPDEQPLLPVSSEIVSNRETSSNRVNITNDWQLQLHDSHHSGQLLQVPWQQHLLFSGLLLALLTLLYSRMAQRITAPLSQLNTAARAVANGNYEAELPTSVGELRQLTDSFRHMRSELQRREKNLRDSHGLRFAQLLEQLDNTFFYYSLNAEGGITQVSSSVEKVLGLTPQKFIRKYQRLFTDHAVNERNWELTEQALSGQEVPAHEVEVRGADGSLRRLELYLRPLTDDSGHLLSVEVLASDISVQHTTTEYFRGIVDQAPDAILIAASDGTVRYANQQAAALFGYRVDQLMGRLVDSLVPAELRHLHGDLRDQYMRRPSVRPMGERGGIRAARSDGSSVPVEITLSPLNVQGEMTVVAIVRDATEKQRAARQLEDSEARFRSLVANMPGAVYRCQPSAQRSVAFISTAVAELTGYTADEFGEGGRSLNSIVLEDDLPEVEKAIAKSLATRGRYAIEYRILHAAGHELWLQDRGQAIYDSSGRPQWLDGSLQDVTARKQVETELRAANKRLTEVTDSIPGVVFQLVSDEAGIHPTFISNGVEKMLGVPREQVRNDLNAIIERVHPEDRAAFAPALQASETNGTWQARFRIEHPSRGLRWIEGRASSVQQGEIAQLNGYWLDVTERRAIELELEHSKEIADSANRAKSAFLASMSHEIRTPMNAVIGMTELCLETGMTPQQRGYLEKVRTASGALLEIINDILDLSKIEAGKLVLDDSDFNLSKLLETIGDMFALPAQQRGLELLYWVDPAVPEMLRGDALRLKQILINLIGNSIKFTEHGEIVLGLNVKQRHARQLELEISVRDTGIGLSEEQRARLFEAFNQADQTTSRRFGGTGLGLAICKRLVELMNGRIWVESTPEQGSNFRFTCWLQYDPEQKPITWALRSPEHISVLVVDDNETAREVLGSTLKAWRVKVEEAHDGASALQRLETPPRIDIAILDWRMPGMDGLELARRIQQFPEERRPYLILMSAFGEIQLSEMARAAGIQKFLPKPINPSDLLNSLADCLATKPAPTPLPPPVQEDNRQILKGQKILVAEDNSFNQELARELLERTGARVVVANNGREALQQLNEQHFDIVLMDCQMPEMDGYEATKRLRENPEWQDLPVIAMTANALSGEREHCLAAGMNDHLGKPVVVKELYATLTRWLENGKSRDRAAVIANTSPPPEPEQ